MAALPQTSFITPEAYLERERVAETKSEYHNGIIVAMAGASPEHSAITFNISVRLGTQLLNGNCRGFSSDLRVRVPACNRYYYPDASIVCGEPRYEMLIGLRNLLNPSVLIEVLSESTASADRDEKWHCYRTLESLTTYVLVAQDRPRIEVFSRMEDGDWRWQAVEGLDGVVRLSAIGCELTLAEVYANVDFPAVGSDTEDMDLKPGAE